MGFLEALFMVIVKLIMMWALFLAMLYVGVLALFYVLALLATLTVQHH